MQPYAHTLESSPKFDSKIAVCVICFLKKKLLLLEQWYSSD